VIAFIDGHREQRTETLRWGVEPICTALQFAPSTYYAAKSRPRSARQARDDELKPHIERVWRENRCCYGVRKVWRQLRREGITEPRCRIERLMREMGVQGRRRGARTRTTIPAETGSRPADLVERAFTASRPNELWIADITYVATWSGFAYTAFVTDVFSRRILGWRTASSLRAELALDALEMAIWTRAGEDLSGLTHHSDRGVQYLSIVYTERLAAEHAVTSAGSRGDSYDNAMAETIIGLYKTECIRAEGPWRTVDDVELATLAWVHWWNTQRLLEPLGYVPPVEFENRSHTHPHPSGDTVTVDRTREELKTE
jgi:putative transposase